MKTQPPYYPIVYVRGFAATRGEIEDTVATPYMGFNLGATKIRQDHKGKIVRFVFESPLVRLMKDHGYLDTYKDGDVVPPTQRVSPKSLWIFRYYDQASQDLGPGERRSILQIAQDLRRYILRVRASVCGNDKKQLKNFRVCLVAHSMGGLICRCYLQNLCANGTGNAALDAELGLKSRPRDNHGHVDSGVHLVDKAFTYATPHNGIDLLGFNAPDLGSLDPLHVRNFNRQVMHEYLALPGDYEPDSAVNSLNGTFPVDRFFCLVGTNYQDFTAMMGLSRAAAGAMSDGLVTIPNAAVEDSPRAFVHRSHSGHYGIVNSEEGYQNLRRFLFGDVRVDLKLVADQITLPRPVQKLKDKGKQVRASYHIETTARVRGATYYLHERKVEQESSILREYDKLVKDQRPVYLFTGYLMKSAKTAQSADKALAYAVRLSIRVPSYEVDNRFWFDEHFEGGFVYDETVTFHLYQRAGSVSIKYGLTSRHGLGEAPLAATVTPQPDGSSQIEIPLGFDQAAAEPPCPGFRGKLLMIVNDWNK